MRFRFFYSFLRSNDPFEASRCAATRCARTVRFALPLVIEWRTPRRGGFFIRTRCTRGRWWWRDYEYGGTDREEKRERGSTKARKTIIHRDCRRNIRFLLFGSAQWPIDSHYRSRRITALFFLRLFSPCISFFFFLKLCSTGRNFSIDACQVNSTQMVALPEPNKPHYSIRLLSRSSLLLLSFSSYFAFSTYQSIYSFIRIFSRI